MSKKSKKPKGPDLFDTSFGRTSPASSERKTTHSGTSSELWWERTPPSLVHEQKGSGRTLAWFPDPKGASDGAFSTLNSTASLSDASASSLSSVLLSLPEIPQRFYLTERVLDGLFEREKSIGLFALSMMMVVAHSPSIPISVWYQPKPEQSLPETEKRSTSA